jgi:hypothetical protein
MRTELQLLLTLTLLPLLLVAAGGTAGAPSASSGRATGAAAPHFFPASDKRLLVVGRTQANNDANGSVGFDWPSVHITARVSGAAPVSIWLSEPPPGNATPPASCVRCVPPFTFGIRYLVFVDGKLVQKLNTTAIAGSPVTEWALCPACFPSASDAGAKTLSFPVSVSFFWKPIICQNRLGTDTRRNITNESFRNGRRRQQRAHGAHRARARE